MGQTGELKDVPTPSGKLMFFDYGSWVPTSEGMWITLVIFAIIFSVCVFCCLITWGLWEFYKRRYNKRAEVIRAKFKEEEIPRKGNERMAVAKVQREYGERQNSFENVRKPSFESVTSKQPIEKQRGVCQATPDAVRNANKAPTGLYESLAVGNYETTNMTLLPEAPTKQQQQDQGSADTATAFKENDPSASALRKPNRQQTKTMTTLLTNVKNEEKEVEFQVAPLFIAATAHCLAKNAPQAAVMTIQPPNSFAYEIKRIPDRSTAPINIRKSISPRSHSLTPKYQRIRPPTRNRTRSNSPNPSVLGELSSNDTQGREKYAPEPRYGSRVFESSGDLTSSYTEYLTPATSPTASATVTPTPTRRPTKSRLNKLDPEKYSSASTSDEEFPKSTSNASQLPFHRRTASSDTTNSSAASSATWTSARSTTTPIWTPQKIVTQKPTFENKDDETSPTETMRKAEDNENIYAGEAPFWTNKALDRSPTASLANAGLIMTLPSAFTQQQQTPPQQQYQQQCFNDNNERTLRSVESRPSLIVDKMQKAIQSPRVSRERALKRYDSLSPAKSNDGSSHQFYANHP